MWNQPHLPDSKCAKGWIWTASGDDDDIRLAWAFSAIAASSTIVSSVVDRGKNSPKGRGGEDFDNQAPWDAARLVTNQQACEQAGSSCCMASSVPPSMRSDISGTSASIMLDSMTHGRD